MTMERPTKRSCIELVSRDRLVKVAKQLRIRPHAGTKAKIVEELSRDGSIQLQAILGHLRKAELKSICLSHGLPGTARTRSALISRIIESSGGAPIRDALELIDSNNPPEYQGHRWDVVAESPLADAVAFLIVGQFKYIEQILHNLASTPFRNRDLVLEQKSAEIRAPKNEKEREHRDGWIMQMLSWIASHRDGVAAGAISPPHVKPAAKGFDSLSLDLDASGAVEALVMTEDKATKNARKTVTDKVWPEIRELETGVRDGELLCTATAVLERYIGNDEDKVRAALDRVFWQPNQRRYRVCIASHDFQDSDAGRGKLFKGYSTVATGDLKRRRADTLHTAPDVRAWMDSFCENVADSLDKLRDSSVR